MQWPCNFPYNYDTGSSTTREITSFSISGWIFMKAQWSVTLEILQLHLLMIHGVSWSNPTQPWLQKEGQGGRSHAWAWKILYKQPGKKQSRVSAISKDNRTTKDKHRGPRRCFAASKNSLFLVPGDNRTVFWRNEAWEGWKAKDD